MGGFRSSGDEWNSPFLLNQKTLMRQIDPRVNLSHEAGTQFRASVSVRVSGMTGAKGEASGVRARNAKV